jgi:hypothetical protein
MKMQPKSDRFGLFSLLTGGLFHFVFFPVYLQEPLYLPIQPVVQFHRITGTLPPPHLRLAFLRHLSRVKQPLAGRPGDIFIDFLYRPYSYFSLSISRKGGYQ